jgi:hypothetical protein
VALATANMLIGTVSSFLCNKVLASFLPRLGYIFEKISVVLCLKIFLGSFVRWVRTLEAVWLETTQTEIARRCFSMPCMPIRTTELDQEYALFVTFPYFLYEYSSFFLEFLKFLRFHFTKFNPQAQHHTTWAGISLGRPR